MKRSAPRRSAKRKAKRPVVALRRAELRALKRDLEQRAKRTGPVRLNADPKDVQRSLARLVLALVEFLRQLLERQAIRRMDAGTLNPAEIENIGLALMRLERTVRDMARRFDLAPEDLNLDLGPLGRLS